MTKRNNVYLYWPNIVDYCRLILWCVFLALAFHHPVTALIIYIIIDNLDALDGVLARKLNQTSHLGTALDFAIDRVTTASLLLILAILYPSIWWLFCCVMALELGSHFMHLYSSAWSDAESHKKLDDYQSRLLSRYYHHRPTLYSICFCFDAFLLATYIFHFYPKASFIWIMLVCLPGFLLKNIVHVLQTQSACQRLTS